MPESTDKPYGLPQATDAPGMGANPAAPSSTPEEIKDRLTDWPLSARCDCGHPSSIHSRGVGGCNELACFCDGFNTVAQQRQTGSYGPYPTSQGVKGYRDLTPDEVALINVLKSEEERIALLWGRIERDSRTDARWVNVARTHFQEGFSALIRSIAQPYDPFAAAFANNQQDEVEQVIPSRAPHLRDNLSRRPQQEPDYQPRYAGGDQE